MAFYIACGNTECNNNVERRCKLDTINLEVYMSGGFMKCLNFHPPLPDPEDSLPVSHDAGFYRAKFVPGGVRS